MTAVINVSSVTDYSGEYPVKTDSNPVTTVIRQTPPAPIITRIFYCLPCGCDFGCGCCECDCDCNCNCCDCRCCGFGG